MQDQAKISKYQQIKRYFLTAMVALLSLSAMLGISMVLLGSFSWEVVKVIGTTITLGISALLISGSVARLNERSLVRILMWVALVANLLVTLYVILGIFLGIWNAFSDSCGWAEYSSTCTRGWRSLMENMLKIFLICLNMAFSLSMVDEQALRAKIAAEQMEKQEENK